MSPRQLTERLGERVREWNITVETTLQTQSSFLAFGSRGDQAVVLKVLRAPGDEWRIGEILEAFDGSGTVRVYAHIPGAVLLENLNPGTSLVPLVLHGRDEEATEVILLDSGRGWVAIDPKGVVGEVEYEVGASLRNPVERPELFASPQIVERRLRLYAARLHLDADRALQWSFSQAVLSAIWSIEDGIALDVTSPGMMLAQAIQPLLG